MKIVRENQTIVPCDTPDIFTNVTAGQYALLWPLAMRYLYLNEQVKFPYLYPYMKEYSKRKWFKFYIKRGKISALNQGRLSGNMLYCFNLWRLGNKKLIKYIKNGKNNIKQRTVLCVTTHARPSPVFSYFWTVPCLEPSSLF